MQQPSFEPEYDRHLVTSFRIRGALFPLDITVLVCNLNEKFVPIGNLKKNVSFSGGAEKWLCLLPKEEANVIYI